MIIIEGIDRVGKTTLCHKIREELGLPVFRGIYKEIENIKDKNINDEKINTLEDKVRDSLIEWIDDYKRSE